MTTPSLAKPVTVVGAAALVFLAGAVAVSAHDFWIVPNAFAVAVSGSLEVRGQTSVQSPTSVTIDAGRQARATSPRVEQSGGEGALSGASQARGDSAAVAAVVDRFHAAIAAGDGATALSLLTPDAVILESGGVETREEDRVHHLPSDIAFATAVKSDRGPKRVFVRGDVAWVASTSTASGEFRGRPVKSAGAELLVLARSRQEWKISAIHWSSRTRRAPGT